MPTYSHLGLREFYGCCGGMVFGTFPSGQTVINDFWDRQTQDYYRKANTEQLARVQGSIDELVAHDNWQGAFIIAALTQTQDKCYSGMLEKAGFVYSGNSINTKTNSTMHLWIKHKNETSKGYKKQKRES